MATPYGQTSFIHKDYQVQREFERVGRQISEMTAIQAQGAISSDVPIETIPNATKVPQWALTCLKNGIPVNDTKIVQGVNFVMGIIERTEPTTEYSFPIEFDVIKSMLATNLKSQDNAVQMNILAKVVTQFLDWYYLTPQGTDSIVVRNKLDDEGNYVLVPEGIFKGKNILEVRLKNDEYMPGENKVYGTDIYGNKGWFATTAADKTFTFTQHTPSTLWAINHNMNKYPSVSMKDFYDNDMEGDIEYVDENNINIHLLCSESGKAYLN